RASWLKSQARSAQVICPLECRLISRRCRRPLKKSSPWHCAPCKSRNWPWPHKLKPLLSPGRVLLCWQSRLGGCRLQAGLQDYSFVAHAAGDPLAVKIFEQRNRVFARNAREVLEFTDIYFRGCALVSSQNAAQILKSALMKHQVIRQLDQYAVPQQKRHQLLRPCLIDRQRSQHFLHQRNLEP